MCGRFIRKSDSFGDKTLRRMVQFAEVFPNE